MADERATFQIWGSVEALDRLGRAQRITPTQRAVLALLLMEHGKPVSFNKLREIVWSGNGPAKSTIEGVISAVRKIVKTVEPQAELASALEYVTLRLPDPAVIDHHRFEILEREIRAAADDETALVALSRVKDEFLNEPLAGLKSWQLNQIREDLIARRRKLGRQHVELLLKCGKIDEGLAVLDEYLRRWPADQHLRNLRDGKDDSPKPVAAAELRLVAELVKSTDLHLVRPVSPAVQSLVEVERSAMNAVIHAPGHLVVTGRRGTGKSVLVRQCAERLREAGRDVVLLRSDELRPEGGRFRLTVPPQHDFVEVLTSWHGRGRATVFIDVLEQESAVSLRQALADLAFRLSGTRWRVVLAVRDHVLHHDAELRRAFVGPPADRSFADSALAHVSHVLLGDFDERELSQVRHEDARVSALLDAAGDRLRSLLTTPINLGLVRQLPDTRATSLTSLRHQLDVLDRYWQGRAEGDRGVRLPVLKNLVDAMVGKRSQVVRMVEIDPVDVSVVVALCDDGVLRSFRTSDGVCVEFSHPLLFDQAVATLVLGGVPRDVDADSPFEADPNLALTVRMGVELWLARVWHTDPTRASFWRLGARLAGRAAGHALVADQLARVALAEIGDDEDCAVLARACLDLRDYPGRTVEDTRQLALLVSRSAVSSTNGRALSALVAVVAEVSDYARAESDLEAALFAVELAREVIPNQGPDRRWAQVMTTCAELAATRPHSSESKNIAGHIGVVLAHLASSDAEGARPALTALTRPEALAVWGVRHLNPMIAYLGALAAIDPGLAASTAGSAWCDEACRSQIVLVFPELLRIAPQEATEMWISAVDAPDMYTYPPSNKFTAPPFVQIGSFFDFPASTPAGEITRAWVFWLEQAAKSSHAPSSAAQIVDLVMRNLHHHEAWEWLLYQAASSDGVELARLLLPALTKPNLFVMPTRLSAAHVARRLSRLLASADHEVLEHTILASDETGSADTVLAALDVDRLRSPEARQRAANARPLPPLIHPDERFAIVESRPRAIAADRTVTEVPIEQWLNIACTQLQHHAYDPAAPVDHALRRGLSPARSDDVSLGLPDLVYPFLESPDAWHREMVTCVLEKLVPDVDALVEIEHRLLREPAPRVLAILFLLLANRIPNQPHEIDQTLQRVLEHRPELVDRPAWLAEPAPRHVAELICRCLTGLAVAHRTVYAHSRVTDWFADPAQHPDQVARCVVELRDLLNAPMPKPVRDVAFHLITTAARVCSEAAPAEGTTSGRVAAELASSLYMCSGALDHIGLPETVARRGNTHLYANAAIPILRLLSGLRHPAVTRNVVQLCLYLAPSRGVEVFDVIANVLETHDDEYLRQAVSPAAVLEVVDRHVIATDEPVREQHRVTGLRRLLELLASQGRGDSVVHADRLGKNFSR